MTYSFSCSFNPNNSAASARKRRSSSSFGLFFNIPGVLLGPFVGALLFEWIGGRPLGESTKAGLGATLGLLAGAVGKLAGCLAMMGLFGLNVVWRSCH